MVSILLEKGADPKAQDNRGERPGDKFDPEVGLEALVSCFLAWSFFGHGRSGGASSSCLRLFHPYCIRVIIVRVLCLLYLRSVDLRSC